MKSRKWIVKPKAPTTENVVQAYYAAYERRYRSKPDGSLQRQQIQKDLAVVVARVGVEKALKAVNVIFFDQRLRWMQSRNKASFLASKANYENHVADVVDGPSQEIGESAQYRGPQSDQPGSRKLW